MSRRCEDRCDASVERGRGGDVGPRPQALVAMEDASLEKPRPVKARGFSLRRQRLVKGHEATCLRRMIRNPGQEQG